MKVLVVSFDKTLTESLRSALSGHDVHVAKNTEEAIKMMPSDIEGVIYDAISGAISEEDINTLYTKKFSNARYVILYDELFPVDAENIIVPQKLLVPRDESPEEIVRKLEEFPVEAPQEEAPLEPIGETPVGEAPPEAPEEFEIEATAFETPTGESLEELAESVEEALKEIESAETPSESPAVEETPVEETPAPGEAAAEEVPPPSGGRRVLIVSFDQTLIDSLTSAFEGYEVRSVKTVKQAMEEGREADLIVFDAISGVIAEKGLIDMAEDPELSRKFYLILIDDLFPINVDGIPLERKVAVSRDTDPVRLREIVEEQGVAVSGQPAEQPSPEAAEPPAEEAEAPPELPEEEPSPVEETGESVPEIEISAVPAEIPEIEVEERTGEHPEEEEIPALAALEKIIEEQKLAEEKPPETAEEPPQPPPEETHRPPAQVPRAEIERLVEEAVARALSEERMREILSKVLEERIADLRDTVGEAIRGEVERAFEELDIRNLIRQATYQALKERLEELIS